MYHFRCPGSLWGWRDFKSRSLQETPTHQDDLRLNRDKMRKGSMYDRLYPSKVSEIGGSDYVPELVTCGLRERFARRFTRIRLIQTLP